VCRHSPPYTAVITLAVLTAFHWRAIRGKLILAGIMDPMALTSMHALLDVTETSITESYSTAEDRTAFFDKLYAPEIGRELNDDGYTPKPSGFDDDDVEASFDAFASAAAGTR
jgi:hypothetical protein